MSDASIISLHFEDSGEWYSLPNWAEYFISVGKQFAFSDFDVGSRIVTAIVVPTRTYCAAFISLGMVVSDAVRREHTSKEAHFKRLLALQPGTPVIYREKPGKTFKGILRPPKELHGKQCVGVQVYSKEGGELTIWISEAYALKVHPAKHSGKLPKKQSGKNKHLSNEFVISLLGDFDQVQLGIQSKLVCAIVGKKSLLEDEIRRTPLAVYLGDDRRAEGWLQDVLRVDRFVIGEKSHRSALIPVGTSQPSSEIISKTEMGVVFDGAAGFLKWGTMWQDRHQVIVLDRTDRDFDDAIHAINSRFSQNRINTKLSLPCSDIPLPPGCEILAFRETIP